MVNRCTLQACEMKDWAMITAAYYLRFQNLPHSPSLAVTSPGEPQPTPVQEGRAISVTYTNTLVLRKPDTGLAEGLQIPIYAVVYTSHRRDTAHPRVTLTASLC